MASQLRNYALKGVTLNLSTMIGAFIDQEINPMQLGQDSTAGRVVFAAALAGVDALLITAFHEYMDPSYASLATTFLLLPQAQLASLIAVLLANNNPTTSIPQ